MEMNLFYNGVKIGTGSTMQLESGIFRAKIRQSICSICRIRPEAYDEAHYDLAEEWFRRHDYLEYTAKVFMLSKTYHRWWNQQLAQVEDEFLQRCVGREIAPAVMWKILREKIVTMNIHPSAELRREMHNEGAEVLRHSPDMWKNKIYRNGY